VTAGATPTTLVTGAATGMGAAVASTAGARGHELVLIDRNGDALEASAAAAREAGAGGVSTHIVDVTDAGAVRAAIDAGADAVGPLSGAICCAGIDQGGATHELDVAVWDRVLSVNLRGTFLTCQHVIRHLLDSRRPGAIVCISSVLATVATPGGTAAYCASKGGVASLVRSLAVEYADRGIRVNALAPGATETELMWANVPLAERDAMRTEVAGEIPAGRLATPSEQAEAALWLLSDAASYMTGAELVLDGGVLARAALSV
jgi:NAD(P)-dependent dehydrogenase (short-subunit alcohol dehydrogenase family)